MQPERDTVHPLELHCFFPVLLFPQKTLLDRRATRGNLSEKTKVIAHGSTRHNFSLVSKRDTLGSHEPPLAYERSTEMTDTKLCLQGDSY